MYKECKVCGKLKYFGQGKGRASTCDECLAQGKKWCSECSTVKDITDFVGYPVTTRAECKECYAKKQATRRSTPEGRAAARVASRKCCAKPEVRKVIYARRNERYATDEDYREKQKSISRDWHNTQYAENVDYRESIIARTQNRRSKVAGRGKVSADEWHSILQKFDYSCAYCGATEPLTMEHVLAIHNGGTNEVCNVVPACRRCNSSNGTKDLSDWYKQQSFYRQERLRKVLSHLKGGI